MTIDHNYLHSRIRRLARAKQGRLSENNVTLILITINTNVVKHIKLL